MVIEDGVGAPEASAYSRLFYISDILIYMGSDTVTEMDKTLLASIEGKKRKLDALRPFPPSIVQKLKEQFLVEWTYNSNAIEGNTLTLQETDLVLNRGLTIGNKSLKEHFEALNHKECIELIEKFVEKKEELSTPFILQLHKIIPKNIDDYQAGVYRKTNVRILGAVHISDDQLKDRLSIFRCFPEPGNCQLLNSSGIG